jgi:hypothetical protein
MVERYENVWNEEDAAFLASVGSKSHVGGVSALVHYGLTTAVPWQVHVYCDAKDVASVRSAVSKSGAFSHEVAVRVREARVNEDVVDGQLSEAYGGGKVRVANVYRAVVEALLDDEFVDDDCKFEVVAMFKGRPTLSVGRVDKAAYYFGPEARRRVKAYFDACK